MARLSKGELAAAAAVAALSWTSQARAQALPQGIAHQMHITCVMDSESTSCSAPFKVPNGYLFQIQSFSVVLVNNGDATTTASLRPLLNGAMADYETTIPPTQTGAVLNLTAFAEGKGNEVVIQRDAPVHGSSPGANFYLSGVLYRQPG